MEDMLIQAGLNELQAKAYLYLLEHPGATPPQVAEVLQLTRPNAYKILDKLMELGLASRTDVRKKLTYTAEDPIALTNILAEERNRVIALEQAVKTVVSDLRRKYQPGTGSSAKLRKGKKAVVGTYETQAKPGAPIYFIKSRADIPFMGYETMNYIRKLPHDYGNNRFGITPDGIEGPLSPDIDKRTRLTRTWMPADDYIAPVEWSVSEDTLAIIVFGEEPYAWQIKDKVVAEAFLQLWKLLDNNLRANPDYKNLPRNAKRAI